MHGIQYWTALLLLKSQRLSRDYPRVCFTPGFSRRRQTPQPPRYFRSHCCQPRRVGGWLSWLPVPFLGTFAVRFSGRRSRFQRTHQVLCALTVIPVRMQAYCGSSRVQVVLSAFSRLLSMSLYDDCVRNVTHFARERVGCKVCTVKVGSFCTQCNCSKFVKA